MTINIAKQYRMNYFDPSENSNKVWIATAYDDGTFETRFGRVRDGANLANKQKNSARNLKPNFSLKKSETKSCAKVIAILRF